jgi:hypothetical protein
MDSQEIFHKYPQVLGVIRIEEGKVILDSDSSKIDDESLVIFLDEVISQYLQSNASKE